MEIHPPVTFKEMIEALEDIRQAVNTIDTHRDQVELEVAMDMKENALNILNLSLANLL